jgi:NitT/TauT family transport system ATP-binding protein
MPYEAEGRALATPVTLKVTNISKTFANQGKTEQVLNLISFDVKKGEIISILGQSGCGKSTLLNIIGGFEPPDSGHVLFDEKPVEHPHRECVMLFQNYGLLPWRTVIKNVELSLENTIKNRKQRRELAYEYVKLVGLEERSGHFPHQISGGMQQRVAIARALAVKPKLILMDEPFAALDTFNRYYLQDELIRIQKQEKTTIILVTHDIDEAVYLSDRVIIMRANPGEIQKELTITTPRPRDRGHGDFQYFRKLILEEFNFNRSERMVEYNI